MDGMAARIGAARTPVKHVTAAAAAMGEGGVRHRGDAEHFIRRRIDPVEAQTARVDRLARNHADHVAIRVVLAQ
jgi:hypothetical protein